MQLKKIISLLLAFTFETLNDKIQEIFKRDLSVIFQKFFSKGICAALIVVHKLILIGRGQPKIKTVSFDNRHGCLRADGGQTQDCKQKY